MSSIAPKLGVGSENANIYTVKGREQADRLHRDAQYYLTLAARKRDEHVAIRDLCLEIAVIVLIGIEIVLGGFGIKEGAQQLALQKQAWEKENAQPKIILLAAVPAAIAPGGINFMTVAPDSTLSSSVTARHLLDKVPMIEHSFALRNVGDGWLRRPKITASVDPGKLVCVSYPRVGGLFDPDKPCKSADVDLPDLMPHTGAALSPAAFAQVTSNDLHFFVYYTVASDATNVRLHITVTAENHSAITGTVNVPLQ